MQEPSAPLVRLEVDAEALPVGATGELVIDASPAEVWRVVRDIDRYAERLPMVHRMIVDGDKVVMKLKFRLAIFSARFGFTSRMTSEPERWLDLAYVSGEPEGIHLRFELEPANGGQATRLSAHTSFDILSLGWLVKVFLRHHPEIRYGVFTGTTLVLLDAVRRATLGLPPPG